MKNRVSHLSVTHPIFVYSAQPAICLATNTPLADACERERVIPLPP